MIDTMWEMAELVFYNVMLLVTIPGISNENRIARFIASSVFCGVIYSYVVFMVRNV